MNVRKQDINLGENQKLRNGLLTSTSYFNRICLNDFKSTKAPHIRRIFYSFSA